MTKYLTTEFYSLNYSLGQRLEILEVITAAMINRYDCPFNHIYDDFGDSLTVLVWSDHIASRVFGESGACSGSAGALEAHRWKEGPISSYYREHRFVSVQ